MRTGGVDPSRMWRKKRSPKPKQKKVKQPATLPPVNPVIPDIEDKVPARETIPNKEEETTRDTKDGESDKGTELNKDDECVRDDMGVSKELAEEVDRVNEQVNLNF